MMGKLVVKLSPVGGQITMRLRNKQLQLVGKRCTWKWQCLGQGVPRVPRNLAQSLKAVTNLLLYCTVLHLSRGLHPQLWKKKVFDICE